MRTLFFSNFAVDLLTAWVLIGCGATAIQPNTAFRLKIVLWFVVFVGLNTYVYIKNKIKY